MNQQELNSLKQELMESGPTEDLHHSLEEIQPEDARKIVESMTEAEIYTKVNNRRFQEDYIADYIKFLWDISKTSFWNHVKATLDVGQDLLWSDNMFHFKMLCSREIPDDVLEAVVKYAVECPEREKQNLETIGCVIKAQTNHPGGIEKINRCLSLLGYDGQESAIERLRKLPEAQCPYCFD